jgi:hypothetical protein
MHALPRARVRAAVSVSLAGLFTLVLATTARPQGVAATARATPAPPASDVNTLKRRVDELERRVLELEKQKAEEVELAKEEDALEKKLEQRLAAIEAEQKKSDSADEAAKDSRHEPDFDPLNVVAPFVIRDDDGKVLVRVDRSPAGFARLAVGDLVGSRVVLAAAPGESAIDLTDSSNKVKVKITATPTAASLVAAGDHGRTAMGTGGDGLSAIQVLNNAGIAVAELVGMEAQDGRLQITDAAGAAMIVAAVSTKGVGVVKAGPGGNGPAAMLGNIALPASEIQGRKR